MANYNTFLVVDCNNRRMILTTSSARKAYAELKTGVRIEVWNNNTIIEKIYEADKQKEKNPLAPYIEAEREYIRKKQLKSEKRNAKRKRRRCGGNNV